MTLRRRTSFPGLDPRATRELVALQDELLDELRALRGEAVGITTDTKTTTYACRFNERVICLPPTAGLDLTFPGADSKTQNRWIEVIKIGGGDVRVRATSGNIQGAATVFTITTSGFYYFQSDARTGWWIQPTSSGGLTPPVALADLQSITGPTLLGRVAGVGVIAQLTPTQATALLDTFTAALKGLAPASGGGTTNFLRADGTWAVPPGAGGGLTLSTTEVNLGTGGVSGSFTIAGVGMTPGRPVLCVQAVGPYTGKGVLEDVAEEPVWCTAVVTSAVLITVYWQSARPVGGNVKFNYAVG